jgi:hypothetical protein
MEISVRWLPYAGTLLVAAAGILLLTSRHALSVRALRSGRTTWRSFLRLIRRPSHRRGSTRRIIVGHSATVFEPVQKNNSDTGVDAKTTSRWSWIERTALLFALLTGGTAFYWQWEERVAEQREDITMAFAQLVRFNDSLWVIDVDLFNHGKKTVNLRAFYSEHSYRVKFDRVYHDTVIKLFDHSMDPVDIGANSSRRFRSNPVGRRTIEAIADSGEQFQIVTGAGVHLPQYDVVRLREEMSSNGWVFTRRRRVRNGPRPPQVSKSIDIDDVVIWTANLIFEEGAEVINNPRMEVDPLGGFLVLDAKRSQILQYTRFGELLWSSGRKGKEPGEFDQVIAAVRAPNDQIVVLETRGRLTILDAMGTNVLEVQSLPVSLISDLKVVDDSLLLVAGRDAGETEGALVHLWDFRHRRLLRSFFRPMPPRPDLRSAYQFTGFANVVVRGDTAALVFSLSDTLYFFSTHGDRWDR